MHSVGGKKGKKNNNYLIWAPCLSLSPRIPPIPIDIQGIESSAIEIRTTSSACLDKEANGGTNKRHWENTNNRHWKWSGDKRAYAHGTHAIEPSLISVWLDIQPAPALGVFSFYSLAELHNCTYYPWQDDKEKHKKNIFTTRYSRREVIKKMKTVHIIVLCVIIALLACLASATADPGSMLHILSPFFHSQIMAILPASTSTFFYLFECVLHFLFSMFSTTITTTTSSTSNNIKQPCKYENIKRKHTRRTLLLPLARAPLSRPR